MASVVAVGSIPRRWRTGLRRAGSPHRLVGSAGRSAEAVALVERASPDLVLLDVDGQGGESLALCRLLAGDGSPPVVAASSVLDDAQRTELLDAGASGYVLKTIDTAALVVALQAIAEVAGLIDEARGEGLPPAASRADFLRWTGVAAAAALVVPAASPAARASANPSPSSPTELPELPPPREGESDVLRMQREVIRAMRKPVGERRWVMVMDLRKCSGCDACTVACKAENQLPPGVVYRPVVEETVGTYPNVRRRFLPRPCMQCEQPPCTSVCPVGATWRRDDGVVAIDYEKCIGCRYCLAACPYSARTFDFGDFYADDTPERQPYEQAVSPEYNAGLRRADGGSPKGNARKCHFCLHRLEAGQLPACVTSCIGHATFFGDANDPDGLVSELIGRPEARRLKEELGTSPRVYYLT